MDSHEKNKIERVLDTLNEVGGHLAEMTELLRELAEQLRQMREGDKQPSLFE